MGITKALNDIYIFLIKLKIQIKCLSDEEFYKLLSDKKLDYMQRLYLCYFRYIGKR